MSKALALDINSSDAHRLKGGSLFFYDLLWEEARRECNIAIQLDSNNSDAFRNLAQIERALGEFDIAITHLKKSIDLNPLNSVNYSNLMTSYSAIGQYEEAERILNKAEEIYPDLLTPERIYLYILSDRLDKAEEEIGMLPRSFNEADKGIMRAMILFRRGKKSAAVELLNRSIEPERTGSFYVARAFAFMDQRDDAFLWLEKAYNEKFRIISVKYSPFLAPVRNDPRYTALLKKMNLPTD